MIVDVAIAIVWWCPGGSRKCFLAPTVILDLLMGPRHMFAMLVLIMFMFDLVIAFRKGEEAARQQEIPDMRVIVLMFVKVARVTQQQKTTRVHSNGFKPISGFMLNLLFPTPSNFCLWSFVIFGVGDSHVVILTFGPMSLRSLGIVFDMEM